MFPGKGRLLYLAILVLASLRVCKIAWRTRQPLFWGDGSSPQFRSTNLAVQKFEAPEYQPNAQVQSTMTSQGAPLANETITQTLQNHKILIATFLFGENTANKRSLRLFVESAKRSGVEYLIVGHPAPPFPLPANVKYIKVTWDDLTDRVKERVFDGQEPGEMRSIETYYKINDLKPLFAHIFPEQVQGFDWWGYIDSDLIVGDLRHLLTPDMLSQYDILSPTTRSYAVGPFMLYRNARVVNELFFLARRPLMEIFGVERCRSFDEWGGIFYGLPRGHNPGYNDYRSSMAGIIEYHGKRLGLRWHGNVVQFVWDGFCRGYVGSSCKECELVQLPDGKQKLVQRPLGGSYKMEVFFCHYQYSKQTMEKSLADDARFHELIQEGQYRINFFDGFNFLNTTGPTHLDGQVMLQMPPF